MREVMLFLGIWAIFMFFSFITLSKRIALLSFVPLFCGAIAYFSGDRVTLLSLFLALFLIYFVFSRFLLKEGVK